MKQRPIKLELSPLLRGYLSELTRTGLYGATVEEVADTLIKDHLKILISSKILSMRTL